MTAEGATILLAAINAMRSILRLSHSIAAWSFAYLDAPLDEITPGVHPTFDDDAAFLVIAPMGPTTHRTMPGVTIPMGPFPHRATIVAVPALVITIRSPDVAPVAAIIVEPDRLIGAVLRSDGDAHILGQCRPHQSNGGESAYRKFRQNTVHESLQSGRHGCL